MDIVGRSYVLISSGSLRVKCLAQEHHKVSASEANNSLLLWSPVCKPMIQSVFYTK